MAEQGKYSVQAGDGVVIKTPDGGRVPNVTNYELECHPGGLVALVITIKTFDFAIEANQSRPKSG